MFRFRFEALLHARCSAEEIFQREFVEARRAFAAEQSALRELRSRRRQHIQELHRTLREGFHVSDVELYERYQKRLEREIERQTKQVVTAERKMVQKRSALIDAVKKRKMIEKLKAKDARAHLGAITLSERKFMDDVAAQAFSKSSRRSQES